MDWIVGSNGNSCGGENEWIPSGSSLCRTRSRGQAGASTNIIAQRGQLPKNTFPSSLTCTSTLPRSQQAHVESV